MVAEWDGDDDRSYLLEYAFDDGTSASIALVRALCVLEDVDPTDAPDAFGFTLFNHVDPEALDAILRGGDGGVTVDLTLAGYRVVIEDTGMIHVLSRE